MTCQVCGGKTHITNSRSDGETVRRRRECLECGYRFTTEEVDADMLAQRQRKLDQLLRQAAQDREAVQKKLATIKNLIDQAVNIFN